ncbi:MAG: ABC transporter substrate-binding protein [Chloroflexota bacterium]
MTFRRLPILILLALLLVSVAPLAAQDTEDTEILGYTISAPVDGVRTVEHLAGTTEIPADPQRVITLHDLGLTSAAIHLGFQPIGSLGRVGEGGDEFFIMAEGISSEGLTHVGAFTAVNFERVVELEPDLIIGRQFEMEIYDELSNIAPTVLMPPEVDNDDITYSAYLAALLNRTQRHEELVALYEEKIDLIKQLVPNPEEIYVTTFVMADAEGTIQIFGGTLPISRVVDEVGFSRRALVRDVYADYVPGDERSRLSLEVLDDLDADFIFNNYWPWTMEASADIENGPIWETLWAVQNNQYINSFGSLTYGTGMFYRINAADLVLTHIAERDFVTREGGWD